MATPVVLLAFANDRADGVRYLRNLPEERRAILAALDGAASAGVCEVATLPNATAGELLDAFRRRRDRVAVLHFGGHAGSYALLLEDAAGRPDAALGEGLAAFLAQQRGLELVVLNACATEGHVRRLLAAGVPAVVATSRAVEDAVALDFARELYQGLGAGSGVRRAFDEASAAVRLRRGGLPNGPAGVPPNDDVRRDVGAGDGDGPAGDGLAGDGGWPWGLFVREGAERVERWTLAEAAGDPLWGLPPLPPRALPERPFRHLAPFGREHAALFFGRGAEVRELYDRVTGADGPPVVLLYGQTGVGKSSLLDAGLLPRLEASHAVRYARRDHARGLLGTLADALGAWGGTPGAVAAGWAEVEREAGRPLLVVVDQAEEAFTRAEADDVTRTGEAPVDPAGAPARELDAFAAAAAELFAGPGRRPLGRLVLGFRKEWLAEVEGAFAAHRVPRGKQFLGRLTRAGAAAAVTGPARAPALRARYGLTVEDGLAELVADDLLADRESHVAPVLQILLAGLWDRAVRRSAGAPRFDRALYDEARAQGLHLDAFLEQQLAALRAWHPPAVDSGLALDYLAAHTTPLGTARERSAAEDAAAYPQAARTPPPGLRARCTALYLLTERAGDAAADQTAEDGAGGPAARLAHDTLAPLVRRRAALSDAPGQRARRVLETRASDWAAGREVAPLDEYDLGLVEQGAEGMRAWTPDEARLVDASRRAREARRRERGRQRAVGWGLAGLVVVSAIAAVFMALRATDRANQAESMLLATRSAAYAAESPDLALLAAAAAMERRPGPEARTALLEAARRARGLALVVPRAPVEQFLANGDFLTFDGRTAVRWDPRTGAERTRAVFSPAVGVDTLVAGAFSPDGSTFAGLLQDPGERGQAVIVQSAGTPPVVLARAPFGPERAMPFAWALAFSGDGTRLVMHHQDARGERRLLVWTRPRPVTGEPPASFAGPDTVPVAWKAPVYGRADYVRLAVSPSGRWAAAAGTDGHLLAAPLPEPGARPPAPEGPAAAAVTAAGSHTRVSRYQGTAQDVVVGDDGVVTVGKETSSDEFVVVERWDVPRDRSGRVWPAVRWSLLDSLSWSALSADARTLTVGDRSGLVADVALTPDSAAAAMPPELLTARTVDGLSGPTRPALRSPDGRFVATPGENAMLLWRLAPARVIAGGPGQARLLLPVWLASDGRWLYAMTEDTTSPTAHAARSWLVRRDRHTGAVDTLLANRGSTSGWGDGTTLLSADGRWFVAVPEVGGPPVVLRWHLAAGGGSMARGADTLTGRELPPPPNTPAWNRAAVDSTGRIFVVTDDAGGTSTFWELLPGRSARRAQPFVRNAAGAPVTVEGPVALDPTHNCLVTTGGNTLRGWDLNAGTSRSACSVPPGPSAATRYMQLRVDGGRGLLVADDKSVSIWDFDATAPTTVLAGTPGSVEDAVLTSSGWVYRIAFADRARSVLTLDSAAVGDSLLGAEACRLAGVGATRARWAAALSDFDPPKRCGRR